MNIGFMRELAETVWGEIDSQSNEKLQEIIAQCESLTTRNCGWVAYGLKDIVISIAKNSLHDKEFFGREQEEDG